MIKNLFNRLLQGLVVLIVLFTITFFMVKAMPGGPFQSEKAIPGHIKAKIEAYYGLDQPVWVQYFKQLGNYVKGDPGLSLRLEGRPVSQIIGQAFPVSFQLGVVAMAIALTIGIPTGCIAAARKNGLIDMGTMAFAMIGVCLPSFVIGPILAELFGRNLKWFPAMGWDARAPETWILPAITLGLGTAAYVSRLTRTGLIETLSQDFVRTARAKGVPGWKILIRHCLRGGLIPTVAYIGPAFAGIVAGSVVIETIFQIPGMGRQFIKAIETRDAPVLIASVMLYGALVILANLFSDIAGIWLNPRLRSGKN